MKDDPLLRQLREFMQGEHMEPMTLPAGFTNVIIRHTLKGAKLAVYDPDARWCYFTDEILGMIKRGSLPGILILSEFGEKLRFEAGNLRFSLDKYEPEFKRWVTEIEHVSTKD